MSEQPFPEQASTHKEQPQHNLAYYLAAAQQNIEATSRTVHGVVDTSSSADKAEKMEEGLTGEQAAIHARENFVETITMLFQERAKQFEDSAALRAFVESVAGHINKGIVREGMLIRSGADSQIYPYTPIAKLEAEMSQFYDELYTRLQTKDPDPVATAGWIEYRVNFTDHFFADGCGKTSKALSAWVLMRADHELPVYRDRTEMFSHAPKQRRDLDPEVDREQLSAWTDYYHTLFQLK